MKNRRAVIRPPTHTVIRLPIDVVSYRSWPLLYHFCPPFHLLYTSCPHPPSHSCLLVLFLVFSCSFSWSNKQPSVANSELPSIVVWLTYGTSFNPSSPFCFFWRLFGSVFCFPCENLDWSVYRLRLLVNRIEIQSTRTNASIVRSVVSCHPCSKV